MQAVNSFIKLLGKNYYSDLITEINSETIDFNKYMFLVKYQNAIYFELSNVEISSKYKETLNTIKEAYQEALTEIYAAILSHDSLKINTYLDLNAEAVQMHLNNIKRDFYIDEEQSRYYSEVDDNPKLIDLNNKFHRKLDREEMSLNEDIAKLFNNSKNENFQSFYDFEYLHERHIILSLMPFSLFVIGQQFILQIEKIKSKINPKIASSTKKSKSKNKESKKAFVEETYFESFLKLLENDLILKKSTAIGVMVDFKMFVKEIKSEILKSIKNKKENRNDYLDFLINEIEKQNYIKNADSSYVQKWLDEYNISIQEIIEMKYANNPIVVFIDRHYMDMDKYSIEKDKGFLLQTDFRDFFCKYYADELINFIKSLKDSAKQKQRKDKIQVPTYQFLDAFLTEISNDRDIYQSTFIQCYNFGILNYTEKLKQEINQNLLSLTNDKLKPYLDLIKNKLVDSPYYLTDENSLNKWITIYNLENHSFPFLESEEIKKLITKSVNYYLWDENDRALIEDIQLDFYYYAAMTEAKKIISFIEQVSDNALPIIEVKENHVYIHDVFKSSESFDIFNLLLEKFNISRDKIKKRGVQAQLNAIWGSPKSKKEIFKEHAELKDYVSFLNETFYTDYKSRTMSDGSKYHNSIKEWLN